MDYCLIWNDPLELFGQRFRREERSLVATTSEALDA